MSAKKVRNTNADGKVNGQPPAAPVPANKANPNAKKETPKEKNILEKTKDKIDNNLDQWVEQQGYSPLAMGAGALGKALNEVFMPTAWWEIVPVGKAGKILNKGADVIGMGKKSDEATAAAKNASKQPAGAKIKPRAKIRVKCFCVLDNAKGGRDEYERQLKKQQDGINSMTANEYLAERKAFTGKDPCCGNSPTDAGKSKKRNPKVTKDAKAERLRAQTEKYAEEMQKSGKYSFEEADRLGAAKAKQELGRQDALHNQDMVAGGKDQIGTFDATGKQVFNDGDFGFSDTNRHIGSQWNGDRIKSIDAEACQAQKDGKGDEKMNTELRPCGKKEAKASGCKQKNRRK